MKITGIFLRPAIYTHASYLAKISKFRPAIPENMIIYIYIYIQLVNEANLSVLSALKVCTLPCSTSMKVIYIIEKKYCNFSRDKLLKKS